MPRPPWLAENKKRPRKLPCSGSFRGRCFASVLLRGGRPSRWATRGPTPRFTFWAGRGCRLPERGHKRPQTGDAGQVKLTILSVDLIRLYEPCCSINFAWRTFRFSSRFLSEIPCFSSPRMLYAPLPRLQELRLSFALPGSFCCNAMLASFQPFVLLMQLDRTIPSWDGPVHLIADIRRCAQHSPSLQSPEPRARPRPAHPR